MAGKKRGLTANPLDRIAPDTLFRVTAPTVAREEPSPSKYRLEDIRPDPRQARRVLPEDLAGKLAAGKMGPREAIEAMIGRGEANPAVARRLRGLRKLAASIRQHGLINPLTLYQVDGGLVIETGERRYWAHWLLVLEGHPEFMEIRGELVEEGRNATARQLIENWQREDLNAVEKARGLWVLRYALSGVDRGIPPILKEGVLTSGGVDRGIPLIPWGEVQRELGISKDYRIKILRVLYLCAQAQEIITQYDLAERLVRPVTQRLRGRPDLQMAILQKVAKSYDEAAEKDDEALKMGPDDVARLVDQLLRAGEESKPPAPLRPSYASDFKRGLRASLRVFEKVGQEADLDAVLSELVTTPDYAEVGELAARLEPLVRDLAERWRAAQQ